MLLCCLATKAKKGRGMLYVICMPSLRPPLPAAMWFVYCYCIRPVSGLGSCFTSPSLGWWLVEVSSSLPLRGQHRTCTGLPDSPLARHLMLLKARILALFFNEAGFLDSAGRLFRRAVHYCAEQSTRLPPDSPSLNVPPYGRCPVVR